MKKTRTPLQTVYIIPVYFIRARAIQRYLFHPALVSKNRSPPLSMHACMLHLLHQAISVSVSPSFLYVTVRPEIQNPLHISPESRKLCQSFVLRQPCTRRIRDCQSCNKTIHETPGTAPLLLPFFVGFTASGEEGGTLFEKVDRSKQKTILWPSLTHDKRSCRGREFTENHPRFENPYYISTPP